MLARGLHSEKKKKKKKGKKKKKKVKCAIAVKVGYSTTHPPPPPPTPHPPHPHDNGLLKKIMCTVLLSFNLGTDTCYDLLRSVDELIKTVVNSALNNSRLQAVKMT